MTQPETPASSGTEVGELGRPIVPEGLRRAGTRNVQIREAGALLDDLHGDLAAIEHDLRHTDIRAGFGDRLIHVGLDVFIQRFVVGGRCQPGW